MENSERKIITDRQEAIEYIKGFRGSTLTDLSCIDEKLFSDRKFVLAVVKESWWLWSEFPKFKDDKDIAMIVVGNSGDELKEFNAKLRGDRDVVLTACKKNGVALLYTSNKELKNDKELIKISLASADDFWSSKKGVERLYHKYRKEVDILSDVALEKPRQAYYYDEETLKNPDFVEKVKDEISTEELNYIIKRKRADKKEGHAYRSNPIRDLYDRVDDMVLGHSGENADLANITRIFLALTPVPYIHLTVKGVIAAGKGIKTLGEHAYDKYTELKEKKEEEKNSKTL